MASIAKFIKEKREAMGMSQTELAIRAYDDSRRRSYISSIEKGTRKQLNIKSLEHILTVLNSNISFIEYTPPLK